MPTGRSRSEGWKHAKKTGHRRETDLVNELRNNSAFASLIGSKVFGRSVGPLIDAHAGGATAGFIPDVFGGSINGKVDLTARWTDAEEVRFSVKKSAGGQVFLTSVDRFVRGIELSYGVRIEPGPKKMLELFIGENRIEVDRVLASDRAGPPDAAGIRRQERHQGRLVAATLQRIYPSDWKDLMDWMATHAGIVADICFGRGYARDDKHQATHVWYSLREARSPVDAVASVRQVARMSQANAAEIKPGRKNGGSTVLMPFGFLQMHSPKEKNQIQFHHNMALALRTAM